MTKKLVNPLEDPPTASSSDDDEVEISSAENEEEQISNSSSEENEPKDPVTIPSTKTLNSPSAAAPTSDSDSDKPIVFTKAKKKEGTDSPAVKSGKKRASEGTTSKNKNLKRAMKFSGDDEVEISSGEDEPKDPVTIPSTKTPKSPSAAAPTSDSDSDKPIVFTKQMRKEGTDSPAVKSGKKRASEGTTSKDIKRAKKVSGDDDNKKPHLHRLWTEEDEISLLQSMIDFKAETGTSPHDDLNKFFDIAKKSISFDVSKSQFGDKIRGLKKKYFGKRKKKSVESDHDKKCLGLVKSIWGSFAESPVKSKKTNNKKEDKDVKKVEEDKEVVILGGDSEWSNWFEKSFLVRVIVSLGMDECFVKWKWSKVSGETKKRIEEKMKMVEGKEFELLSQKIDVLKEVTSAIAETN